MLKTLILCLFVCSFFGCASTLENEVQAYFRNFNASLPAAVNSRLTQVRFDISMLNQDKAHYGYDKEKVKEIQEKIDKRHLEEEFLLSIESNRLEIEYEIIKEAEISDNISELDVKISGQTWKIDENGVCQFVPIPENAQKMKFRIVRTKDSYSFSGPFLSLTEQAQSQKNLTP